MGIAEQMVRLVRCRQMGNQERKPPEQELEPLVNVLSEQFIQRWDMYPKQMTNGRYQYIAIHYPLTETHIARHLRGEITLGAYLLNEESKGRFLTFDADDEPDWRRLQGVAKVLENEGATGYLERSRRGGHLWYFLDDWQSGKRIRRFGKGVLAHFNLGKMELYPKQDKLETGPGSLIRLPFGIHRKSGRRYGFYRSNGEPLAATVTGQIQLLSTPQTVSKAVFERYGSYAVTAKPKRETKGVERVKGAVPQGGEGERPLSERIKAAITVHQFVSQVVELNERGQGLCPFHDDTTPSFGVHEERNFWHCFACEKGGSVIDFYMQLQGCDFKTAVAELARELLPDSWE